MTSEPWIDRLNNQDCLTGMAGLPEASIDLAFADPPFNIGYDYDIYQDKRACDEYLDWSRGWISAVGRVLKPTGSFWLAIGDEYVAELKVIAHREVGFHLRNWVVWYYTFGVHCTKKFTRSHAHLLYFTKDAANFTFHDQAIRVPSARQLIYGDKRANPQGRVPDDTWLLRPPDVVGGFTPDHDTWNVSRVCGTFKERKGWHGCQMPEQILGRIIDACSNEGDIVLDPFAGSGTTLAVAKKRNRRYVGFELSPEYAARVTARLEAITPGQPLDGVDPPRVSDSSPRQRRRREVVARGPEVLNGFERTEPAAG